VRRTSKLIPVSRPLAALALAAVAMTSLRPAQAASPGWVEPGDEHLRDAVERLVDERVFDIPLLSWPIAQAELRRAIDAARAGGRVDAAHEPVVARIEAALAPPRREWFVAAGDTTTLRTFEDVPRENGELGVRTRWDADSGEFAAVLQVRAAASPEDGQYARPDGSYLVDRQGNWLVSAGWQERWWGGGYEGSLQLSTNARPVFALSLDRETSAPFETRWLSWLGPWTFGTFFGALEGNRPDSNHALLWGLRAAVRPLPGFEFSITRNAQFCGDKPPCSASAFWDVLTGNDNAGENVAAADEPGNQLATYEARWGGRIGPIPVAVYLQNTGETIDNNFPRPLRTLRLANLSTWGDLASGARWRAHVEVSTTTCGDFDDAEITNCAYENGVFTAGYRYRGRVLGHSTDSDSRQVAAGLLYEDGRRSWTARLRRAEINRVGAVPQVTHTVSTGPQVWWVGEGLLKQPFSGGDLQLSLGVEHREDSLDGDTRLEPKGFVRWSKAF
jgi:hypothetical protein